MIFFGSNQYATQWATATRTLLWSLEARRHALILLFNYILNPSLRPTQRVRKNWQQRACRKVKLQLVDSL